MQDSKDLTEMLRVSISIRIRYKFPTCRHSLITGVPRRVRKSSDLILKPFHGDELTHFESGRRTDLRFLSFVLREKSVPIAR